jgi:hypothetical protein
MLTYRKHVLWFSGHFRHCTCIRLAEGYSRMSSEPRPTVVAISAESPRSWGALVLNNSISVLGRVGVWAADTAQEFGAMVAALMGPAVLSVYVFVAWCLAANLGWTDSFVFKTGPLSNWMIWMGVAILVTIAANILRKQLRSEDHHQ